MKFISVSFLETSACVILDWLIFVEGSRLAFHPGPRVRGLSSVEKRSIFCLLQRKLKINVLEKNKTRLFEVEKPKYV